MAFLNKLRVSIFLIFSFCLSLNLGCGWFYGKNYERAIHLPIFDNIDTTLSRMVQTKIVNKVTILINFKGTELFEKYYDSSKAKGITIKDSIHLFDIASLTKVIATTSMSMILFDEHLLKLEDKVNKYIDWVPENITIKDLLNHTSGYPSTVYYKNCKSRNELLEVIKDLNPKEAGKNTVYSDINFIILGMVVEKVTGRNLDDITTERIFKPLGMNKTCFLPLEKKMNDVQIIPSEISSERGLLKGTVNDELSGLLGGISGNAGLFSTVTDINKFIQMIVDTNSKLISENTRKLFSTKLSNGRGLGWDCSPFLYKFAGDKTSEASYGHTGYTGTSMYIDKERNLYVIILSNATYPNRDKTAFINYRRLIHDYINESVDKAVQLNKSIYRE